MNSPDNLTLVLNRTINVSPEKLYRCWTDIELMKEWFCPRPWRVTAGKLDVRAGGASDITMGGPNGEVHENPGIYLEVVPNEKLVFTDAYTRAWEPGAKPFMTGIITFEDLGDGRTNYTATVKHWTKEDCEAHVAMGFHDGWGKATDQLEALAVTL